MVKKKKTKKVINYAERLVEEDTGLTQRQTRVLIANAEAKAKSFREWERAREKPGVELEALKQKKFDKRKLDFKKKIFKTSSQRAKERGSTVSRVLRKAISMAAPTGGIVKVATYDRESRGRGRPPGTYKIRRTPMGRIVKVSTADFKRIAAAERAQMRLNRAQQQAMAEQVAMQQDPRYQQSADDQFLAEPDQEHEYNVAMAQAGYPIQVQEQVNPLQRVQGVGSQIIRGLSSLGGVRAQQEQVVDPYGRTMPVRPQLQQRPQPQGQGLQREPRVSLFSPTPNILNAPNIFNKPGESELLLPRRRRLI